MKKNKNEEMLKEMLEDNFIELSIDKEEDINGGKAVNIPPLVLCYGIVQIPLIRVPKVKE